MLGAGKPNGCRGLPNLYGCVYWVSGLRRLPALNRTPGYALARFRESLMALDFQYWKNDSRRLTCSPPPSRPGSRGHLCSKAAGDSRHTRRLIRPARIFGQLPYRRLGTLELTMHRLPTSPPAQALAFYFPLMCDRVTCSAAAATATASLAGCPATLQCALRAVSYS